MYYILTQDYKAIGPFSSADEAKSYQLGKYQSVVYEGSTPISSRFTKVKPDGT